MGLVELVKKFLTPTPEMCPSCHLPDNVYLKPAMPKANVLPLPISFERDLYQSREYGCAKCGMNWYKQG